MNFSAKNPLKNQSIRLKMFMLVTVVLLSSIFAVLWKTRQIFLKISMILSDSFQASYLQHQEDSRKNV